MPQPLALFATNCPKTLFCAKTYHKIHVFGWLTPFHVSKIDHTWAKCALDLQQCNTPKWFEIKVDFGLGVSSKAIFLHYCLHLKQILIIHYVRLCKATIMFKCPLRFNEIYVNICNTYTLVVDEDEESSKRMTVNIHNTMMLASPPKENILSGNHKIWSPTVRCTKYSY
jgi:hypothetical protein